MCKRVMTGEERMQSHVELIRRTERGCTSTATQGLRFCCFLGRIQQFRVPGRPPGALSEA